LKDGISIQTYAFSAPVAIHYPNYLHGDATLINAGGKMNVYKTHEYGSREELATKQLMNSEFVARKYEDYSTYIDIEPSTGKAMNGKQRLGVSVYTYDCPVQLDASASTAGDTTWLACSLFFSNATWTQDLGFNVAPAGGAGTNAACKKIATGPNGSQRIGGFACSAANILTPLAPSDQVVPNFWIGMGATIGDEDAAKFVGYGGMLQKVDLGSVVVGVIGGIMCIFGLFRLSQAKR